MTGWRGLLRLAWRRDRVMIAATLVMVWLLTYYSAAAMPALYGSTGALVAANEAANASTGVVAMYGHIYDTQSIGGLMTGPAEELLRKIGGVGTFNDIYMTLVGSMGAFATAAFGVGVVMRLRSEESEGHLEAVLATPVTRARFFWSHLTIALVGSVVLTTALGIAMSGAHRTGSTGFWREATPGLAHLPAAWVMIAGAAAAVAWLPRFDWIGWALLAGVAAVSELGALMGLPDWVLKISPYAHTPKIPVEAMSWTPEVVLTLIAAALLAAAYVGYRRRDMPVT